MQAQQLAAQVAQMRAMQRSGATQPKEDPLKAAEAVAARLNQKFGLAASQPLAAPAASQQHERSRRSSRSRSRSRSRGRSRRSRSRSR